MANVEVTADLLQDVEGSDIQREFTGASVLVTGGTGFIGRLLIEKLLRSCIGIHKLYILIRPKKNKKIMDRIQAQFHDPLFDKVRKEQPEFLKRVCIVEGDVSQPGLGLSDHDRALLLNEIVFIFHGAATVRFNESLKSAVETNVRGTREMLALAQSCKKLKAIVHISTTYSNCIQSVIDEELHASSPSGDQLIEMVENIDEKVLNNITLGLLCEFPNTYTYSKRAAEDIINKRGKGLPIAIFRPGIITATVSEPIAGWIDNLYGPTGMLTGILTGIMRVIKANKDSKANCVPGDMVVNACIAVAWKTARDHRNVLDSSPLKSIPMYNYGCSEQNPVTWHDFFRQTKKFVQECPSQKTAFHNGFHLITTSNFKYNILSFFLHWIPAYLIDTVSVLLGSEPSLKNIYKKTVTFNNALAYFSCQEWIVINRNTQALYDQLSSSDKEIFNFDLNKIVWEQYLRDYLMGIRVYTLKDPLDTIPRELKRYKTLKLTYYIVSLLIVYLVFRLLRSSYTRLLIPLINCYFNNCQAIA